jgi:hypothetical protein
LCSSISNQKKKWRVATNSNEYIVSLRNSYKGQFDEGRRCKESSHSSFKCMRTLSSAQGE